MKLKKNPRQPGTSTRNDYQSQWELRTPRMEA